MKTLPGSPKALFALILNLGLGNLLLLAHHAGLTAHVCLSVACIGILKVGFQKAETRKIRMAGGGPAIGHDAPHPARDHPCLTHAA